MMKYLKNNYTEIIIFALFCIGTITISYFNEPWFEELQAWGISKDSIYNILFVVPHFEGHPPLWHLILKCFSHFNVNCEAGIKIPTFLFMFASVWLLIFKSSFPRIVRLTLPFTYFIFYQCSVLSRCYSVFCFALFLAALLYKDKKEHPFRFVSALALLCLSTVYGMVLAVGIIIVWFIELIKSSVFLPSSVIEKDVILKVESRQKSIISKYIEKLGHAVFNYNIILFFKNFIRDKQFLAMILMFFLCLILTAILYPDKNNSFLKICFENSGFLRRVIHPIFVLASDALISDWGVSLDIKNIYKICILGTIVNIFFFCVFRYYKKLLLFFIPYLMFLWISSLTNIALYNTGLFTFFYIFVFWCAIDGRNTQNQISSGGGEKKIICLFIAFMTIITITVQIYWSFKASVNEIKYISGVGRETAQFIKENNLDNYKIKFSDNNNDIYFDNSFCVMVIQYFDKNIFYNFNINHSLKKYFVFKYISAEEEAEIIETIAQFEPADFIITPGSEIDDKLKADYVFLKNFPVSFVWKDKLVLKWRNYTIYAKKELYNIIFKEYKNEKE